MAANQLDLRTNGILRHEKSNCLLLALLALASSVGLPVAFMLARIAVSFVSPSPEIDSAFSPFVPVVLYVWLGATPLISITALLAGRYESRRESVNRTFTDIGILLSFLSLAVWIMPAIGVVLGMITR
jgi:hypothetical protein